MVQGGSVFLYNALEEPCVTHVCRTWNRTAVDCKRFNHFQPGVSIFCHVTVVENSGSASSHCVTRELVSDLFLHRTEHKIGFKLVKLHRVSVIHSYVDLF